MNVVHTNFTLSISGLAKERASTKDKEDNITLEKNYPQVFIMVLNGLFYHNHH